MSKIKQAWSWLTKNDKAASIEKRGDLTIQQIIGIAVSVIVVGLVAAILVILVRNAGDDASDRAQDITAGVAGDPAVYSGTCPTQGGLRVATIARLIAEDAATDIMIDGIPWNAGGGYGLPTITELSATAHTWTAGDDNGHISLGTGNASAVGLFAAASRITETRHNADFDGDGEIENAEVIGVVQEDVDPGDITYTQADEGGNTTGAGNLRGPFLTALPTTDIPSVNVGRQLIVNSRESCWRIV